MDAPFKRSELINLATEVLALECSAKTQVHAEKMLDVKHNEYSRSFFEAANRIEDLKEMGFSLNAAVMSVAGRVPAVEDIDFKIYWWDCDIVNVTKAELYAIAAVIEEYEVPSPDRALAHKIHTKNASKEEWQLFALRYVDYKSRISDFAVLLWEFCSDFTRNKKELAALKSWISKATPTRDSYEVERPVLPPWRDTEFWEADLDEWGYGDDFSPTYEPMSGLDIVPIAQYETGSHPAYNDDVVNNALIDEEEYEVAVLDGDVFEDEELYAAQDVEKNRLLADAANFPEHLRIAHLSDRTVQNFPQIASKSIVLSAQEKEQRAADSVMLTEAMNYSSFKEELRACEEAMKRDPDGKLLDRAFSRLLDSQEKIEAMEMVAQEKSKPFLVAVTGSDVAGPSSIQPSTSSLPDDLDVNAYSQLVAPHESEEEWPSLSTHKTAPTVQQQAPPPVTNTQPVKNVWVEKNKAKKIFMNAGIGGKLTHVQPTTPEFYVDVSKAPTIQDIWGYSLLGQYVGHNPGHFLINSMIKSWGVRAKYKLEEGWFIFSFESEVDREKVLIGGPYLIHGRPMLLKNIPDKFAFNKKDLALVPLWVRIYGLASRFWTPEILGGLASYVGCPMYMDPVTDSRKRNAYARVLVEVNLAAPVKKTVPIKFSDGDTIEVNFLVENQPKFCTDCCSYGHVVSGCQFQAKSTSTAAKHGVQKPVDKPPANDLDARMNNQHTTPSPDANKFHEVVTSNQADCTDVALNRGDTQLQHKQDKQQIFVSTMIAEVHTDLNLVNHFAALNDDTEQASLSDDMEIGTHTTTTSEANMEHLDNDSVMIENGQANSTAMGNQQLVIFEHKAKKVDSSTPVSKASNKYTWNTVGPNTRSRAKAKKT